jgi:hypothetical protein
MELLRDARDEFVQSGRLEHRRARKFLFLAFGELSQVRLKAVDSIMVKAILVESDRSRCCHAWSSGDLLLPFYDK